jgi:ABC-2 type transport system permease protein
MTGLMEHLNMTLRLYARNKMALFYSYLFPVIFFVAFLVLYRYEQPKLIQHMGELLTISVLGGACFGLPTSMVGERERGVWRRYRLAPIATGSLVASTLIARYVTVFSAGLTQLLLAMAIGRWVPEHPFQLWVSFTLVTFAFLGLGLVIAMLADNVPAVQALGQCIFLPMLIIGGVAVKLSTLPEWALHVSAFFPGRYAVETMQECVKGDGLGPMGFNLFALLLIGLAGCVAGAKLFRWDAQQRFVSSRNKAWVGVALIAWVTIGIGAEVRREITPRSVRRPVLVANQGINAPATTPPVVLQTNDSPAPWRAYTTSDYAKFDYNSLPPDEGNVAPIARPGDEPGEILRLQLDFIEGNLDEWPPGRVADPVQRVRNLLFVLAAVDYCQTPIEGYLPAIVLERMRQDFSGAELTQILCWIANHPDEGDDSALRGLESRSSVDLLGFEVSKTDVQEERMRTYFYAVKFIYRLLKW